MFGALLRPFGLLAPPPLKKKIYWLNVGIHPKSNRKIVERGKIDHLTPKYMTTHIPGMGQAVQ